MRSMTTACSVGGVCHISGPVGDTNWTVVNGFRIASRGIGNSSKLAALEHSRAVDGRADRCRVLFAPMSRIRLREAPPAVQALRVRRQPPVRRSSFGSHYSEPFRCFVSRRRSDAPLAARRNQNDSREGLRSSHGPASFKVREDRGGTSPIAVDRAARRLAPAGQSGRTLWRPRITACVDARRPARRRTSISPGRSGRGHDKLMSPTRMFHNCGEFDPWRSRVARRRPS